MSVPPWRPVLALSAATGATPVLERESTRAGERSPLAAGMCPCLSLRPRLAVSETAGDLPARPPDLSSSNTLSSADSMLRSAATPCALLLPLRPLAAESAKSYDCKLRGAARRCGDRPWRLLKSLAFRAPRSRYLGGESTEISSSFCKPGESSKLSLLPPDLANAGSGFSCGLEAPVGSVPPSPSATNHFHAPSSRERVVCTPAYPGAGDSIVIGARAQGRLNAINTKTVRWLNRV